MRIAALLVVLAAAGLPSTTLAEADCAIPAGDEDLWPVAAPETVGIASATLCPVVKWLADRKESNVHAILVARHGTLVFERYFTGRDEHFGVPLGEVAFGPRTRHDERSMTKSIVALLLGIALDELARSLLFEPLGIHDVEWDKNALGNPIAAGALRLRPRDLVKIGQLVLQHGAWSGTQIVSASWIETATSPQIDVPAALASFFNGYGYHFWLGRSVVQGRELKWVAAVGNGGQRLYVVPALDLVVLVHAGMYKSELQGAVPAAIFNQYVLKAAASP
jgi:CubicO group peptidase (beta-lactamase class C family)